MSGTAARVLILIAVLAVGQLLLATAGGREPAPADRWPADEALYAVDGWVTGREVVEGVHGTTLVRREYHQVSGPAVGRAMFVLATSPEAKRIYKTGAEVPFMGSGYTVDPAPPSLIAPAPGRSALIARRQGETWLVLATFGERRGRLGNGFDGWRHVLFDAVRGIPNDYYRASVVAPLAWPDAGAASEIVRLTDTVFGRLGRWYAEPGSQPGR